jgi:hypothetical protein
MRALEMKKALKWLVVAAALVSTIAIFSEPVLARGGAANIMDSPGYQRRLQESRHQSSPAGVPPGSSHRHKIRHRHRH